MGTRTQGTSADCDLYPNGILPFVMPNPGFEGFHSSYQNHIPDKILTRCAHPPESLESPSFLGAGICVLWLICRLLGIYKVIFI